MSSRRRVLAALGAGLVPWPRLALAGPRVEVGLERVEAQAPEALDALRSNLDKRLQDLLGDLSLDPQRLAQEAAMRISLSGSASCRRRGSK